MIAGILGISSSVAKTQGNLNNLIGLPLTLLSIESHHQVAVVEMGMNQPGEIARYTEIAEPEVGLVNNIGPAHIGMLGSIEAIAAAKGELYQGLADSATLVVNLEDSRVKGQAELYPQKKQLGFGYQQGEVRVDSLAQSESGQTIKLSYAEQEGTLSLPFAGPHNTLNAAAAVSACCALPEAFRPTLAQVERGFAAAAQVSGRLQKQTIGNYLVVDDSYNANRASMQAAIATLGQWSATQERRWCAVLGEMRELGEFSQQEHSLVAQALIAAKPSVVACLGKDAQVIYQECLAQGIKSFHQDQDADLLFENLYPELEADDLILIKGSRGTRMERFMTFLTEKDGA